MLLDNSFFVDTRREEKRTAWKEKKRRRKKYIYVKEPEKRRPGWHTTWL